MNRPTLYDEVVARAFAEKLVQKIKPFVEGDDTNTTVQELICVLAEVATDGDYEAYKMARELDDNHHWEVSADLVSTLDAAIPLAYEARDRLVEQWVKEENITPVFSVGDRVQVRGRAKFSGEITKIDTRLAQYLVFCPEKGHVRSGSGTHGTFVNFEDAEAEGVL